MNTRGDVEITPFKTVNLKDIENTMKSLTSKNKLWLNTVLTEMNTVIPVPTVAGVGGGSGSKKKTAKKQITRIA